MHTLTEIELKSTFFETWRNTSQKLKRRELISAIDALVPIYLSARGSNDDECFDITQLDQREKFELLKNILLAEGKVTKFYGMIGENAIGSVKYKLSPPHQHFTEIQCYALAKIDVERNGIRVLKQYQLAEGHETQLISAARKRVQDYLPPLSEEDIIHFVKTGNRDALQELVFNQFSLPNERFIHITSETEQRIKTILLTVQNNTVQDLLSILKQAKAEQEYHFLTYGCFQYPNLSCKRPAHWGQHSNISENTKVPFSHGGGFFNIIKFLTRERIGYPLEKPGKGIQVSTETHQHPRDTTYAEKALQYFDYPARLSGTISAKYLDSAPNHYEAGLRSNFIEFIEDIVITRLDTGKEYRIGTVANKAAFPSYYQSSDRTQPSSDSNVFNCIIS